MYGNLQRPDKGTGSLGVRVTGGSKLSEYSCWDRNTGLLKKQQAPFPAEPCVRSRCVIFVTFTSWWGWKSEREEFDFSIQLCLFPFSLCSSGTKSSKSPPETPLHTLYALWIQVCVPEAPTTSEMERNASSHILSFTKQWMLCQLSVLWVRGKGWGMWTVRTVMLGLRNGASDDSQGWQRLLRESRRLTPCSTYALWVLYPPGCDRGSQSLLSIVWS